MALFKNDNWSYPDNSYPSQMIVEKIEKISKVILESKKEERNKKTKEILQKEIPVPIIFPLNKGNMKILLEKLYDKVPTEFHEYMWLFTLIGGISATIKGATLNQTTLIAPKNILDARDKLVKELHDKKIDVVTFESELDKLGQKYIDHLDKIGDGTADIVNSGAKGNAKDIRKMMLGVGLSIKYDGTVNDVIDRAGVEGLSPTQFFNYSSPAILTQYNKSIGTAKPGYLIKLLTLSSGNIKLAKVYDCKTKKGLKLHVATKEMARDIHGKTIMSGTVKKGSDVTFRSALYCTAPDGICTTCYNQTYTRRFKLKAGDNIGLKAIQSFTGPLTSLALKGSHIGVSLDKEKVNFKDEITNRKIREVLDLTDNSIIAKYKTIVRINKEDYSDSELVDNGDSFDIVSFEIDVDGELFDIELGYPITVYKNNIEETKTELKMVFETGETIATGEYKSSATSVDYLKRLFNNGVKYISNVETLITMIHSELSNTGSTPLHHLELLILNNFIEYDKARMKWTPIRLTTQKYGRTNMVSLVDSIHRLQGAEVEVSGHLLDKGFAQEIGADKENLSDFSKIVAGDYEDLDQ